MERKDKDSRAGARRSQGRCSQGQCSQDNRSHDYGWHSRGYLPHFDGPHVIQHITYRLADSIPKDALLRMDEDLKLWPDDTRQAERRRRIENLMDAGHGSCVLRHPAAARCVAETWFRFDGERYRLLAFVVMPNHCHVMIECLEGFPLWKIVNSWKSYTARWINRYVVENAALGRGAPRGGASGGLWQRDYWDRYIRNERHLIAAKTYIEKNPVAAGLTELPEAWPWSSATAHGWESSGQSARDLPLD